MLVLDRTNVVVDYHLTLDILISEAIKNKRDSVCTPTPWLTLLLVLRKSCVSQSMGGGIRH